MTDIKIVNENGTLVGYDRDTGEQVPIDVQDLHSESVSTDEAHIEPLKLGILPDTHWQDAVPNRFTSQSDLKSKFDTFIDDMNNWGADLVISIGDFIDGVDSTPSQITPAELVTNINNARNYLESTGGSSGTGLDCSVEYVYGNHEYVHGGNSTAMADVYNAFGHNGLSDTFRLIQVKGVNLALLNTAYTTTDYDTDVSDHEIPDSDDPANELAWLRDTVGAVDSPVYSFMHVPISRGHGGSYESTVNEDTAADILRDNPHHVMGFFGHSHNSFSWRRPKLQMDRSENKHLHTGYIYSVEDDYDTGQYGRLEIAPNIGTWNYDSSFSMESTGVDGTFRGSFDNHGQFPRRELFRTQRDLGKTLLEFRFADDHDALTEFTTGAGSGISPTQDGTKLTTGTSSNDHVRAKYQRNVRSWQSTWDNRTQGFQAVVRPEQVASAEHTIIHGQVGASPRYGFKIVNGTAYATVHNGSSETTKEVDPNVGAGDLRHMTAVFIPGKEVRFIWEDDYKTRITSNLPTGANEAEKVLNVECRTTEAVSKELTLGEYMWYQDDSVLPLDAHV